MHAAYNAPDWDRLYAVAETQAGQLTTAQAAAAGYSSQLLNKHIKAGRIVRVGRGVYRLVHFPMGEHEELVSIWLWSTQAGVFSHETALLLHELSDALPSRIHLTLPTSWRGRRLRLPHPRLVLHHADSSLVDRAWHGPIPLTTPARTVNDCAASAVAPDIVEQACREGLRRGLFTRAEIDVAIRLVVSFGRSL